MWLIFHRYVGCHKESLWMLLHAILWELVLEIWHEGKINILPTIICLVKKGIFIPENYFSLRVEILCLISVTALLMALSTGHFCWIMHSFIIHLVRRFGGASWNGQALKMYTRKPLVMSSQWMQILSAWRLQEEHQFQNLLWMNKSIIHIAQQYDRLIVKQTEVKFWRDRPCVLRCSERS